MVCLPIFCRVAPLYDCTSTDEAPFLDMVTFDQKLNVSHITGLCERNPPVIWSNSQRATNVEVWCLSLMLLYLSYKSKRQQSAYCVLNHGVCCKLRLSATALMTSSDGNIFRVTGPFWPVTRSFDVFFDLCLRGIHRSSVNSPHKGQWRGALMFSFICAWINGWVNNRETGDLRRHRANYDVVVVTFLCLEEMGENNNLNAPGIVSVSPFFHNYVTIFLIVYRCHYFHTSLSHYTRSSTCKTVEVVIWKSAQAAQLWGNRNFAIKKTIQILHVWYQKYLHFYISFRPVEICRCWVNFIWSAQHAS